eukprot:TRINITY_DN14686_c0_g1_i1.p1 TRINITY_DN14686_c0_g1~~TRINITY_DN14686_c0_g1_i1.p1  ORF type:complete len:858 (+),score=184.38 TRINITY_DN14686_c0_g1_i1:78-2651(+)
MGSSYSKRIGIKPAQQANQTQLLKLWEKFSSSRSNENHMTESDVLAFLKDYARCAGVRYNSSAAMSLVAGLGSSTPGFNHFAGLVREVMLHPDRLAQAQVVIVKKANVQRAVKVSDGLSDPPYKTVSEAWPLLQAGLSCTLVELTGISVPKWIEVYDVVYNLCVARLNSELYGQLRDYLNGLCSELHSSFADLRSDSLLTTYNAKWQQFLLGMGFVVKMFKYLERHYIEKHPEIPRILTLSISAWREKIFRRSTETLFLALMDVIQRERSGEKIDRSLIRDVLRCYVTLGQGMEKRTSDEQPAPTEIMAIYAGCFETNFFRRTQQYYDDVGEEFLQENGCAEFLSKVEVLLAQENDRAVAYLHPSSHDMLIATCEKSLIARHSDEFQTEFRTFIDHGRLDDVRRMYLLLMRVKQADYIKNELQRWVADQGEALVQNASKMMPTHAELKRAPEAVAPFLELIDRCMSLCRTCFTNDSHFVKAVDNGFTSFINKLLGVFTMAECLAYYCDHMLKSKHSEAEIEADFERVQRLFGLLHDKDMFHAFYRRGLCRRLLTGKANEDLERAIVARLKAAYGAYYTSKLEGMINDCDTSRAFRASFREKQASVGAVRPHGISLDIMVLNSQHWPLTKSEHETLALPQELSDCVTQFERFYLESTQSRKLTWVFNHSPAQVQLTYGKKKHDLMCTTYQACAMLLFDTQDSLSAESVRLALGVTLSEMEHFMQPMYTGKFNPLIKSGDKATIVADDVFTFNADLPNARPPRRFAIAPNSGKVVQTVSVQTNTNVVYERKYKTEAAVVRIMKARRKLHANDLVAEVVTQLQPHFQPDLRVVKRCIEGLVDRDYLDRDTDDRNIFIYQA